MYVDIIFNRENNCILVSERIKRKRNIKVFKPEYEFFYENSSGNFKTLFGTKATRVICKSYKEFSQKVNRLKKNGIRTFESDISIENKILEKYYRNTEIPELNVGFFDIEVEFNEEHGFAEPENPVNKIIAISLFNLYENKNITFTLYPPTLTREEAEKELEGLENTYIFETEEELLEAFLDSIEDIDVLSGWNSTKYDIPYIVGRIKLLFGEEKTKLLCLKEFDCYPQRRIFTQFNKEFITYDIRGRLHIDYLELYMKHSMSEVQSYKLDYIGEIEVGERKVPYDGTLDDLYKKDFRKFIEYSKQDVNILYKIDKKKRYIELSNIISHTNCVTLPTTLGSIALIEQALTLKAHDLKMVCPDREYVNKWEKVSFSDNEESGDEDDEDKSDSVAGAYVIDPKRGLHDFVGSVDINSLYPSIIRSLNMSPEKIFAQVLPEYTNMFIKKKLKEGCKSVSEALLGLFGTIEYNMIMMQTDDILKVEIDKTKEILEYSAKELYNMIYNSDKLCISANGTIFITDKKGLVPLLLEDWFTNRKKMQRLSKLFEILYLEELSIPEDLCEQLKKGM